ncbi:MAG: transporter [Planctomycetota bacterium]
MVRKYIKLALPFLFINIIIFFNQGLTIGCDICGIGGFGGSQGGLKGQSIFSPETQKKNQFSLGFLFEYQDWERYSSTRAHELHEEGRDGHSRRNDMIYNVILGYGVTENLSLTLQLPYVERRTRQVEDHDFLGQSEKSTGMGDIIAYGKYRFYNKLFGAAAIFGVKAPTGQTDEHDKQGSRFEPEEQPGTGSTDFMFGLALNKALGRFTVDGSILYQLKGTGSQDYEFGDVIRANIQGACTIKERGKYPGVQLLAGVNAQFAEKDHQNHDRISDTGGTTVFFSPGLSTQLNDKISSSVVVGLPVIQNLGRDHQDVDFNVLFSIGYSF